VILAPASSRAMPLPSHVAAIDPTAKARRRRPRGVTVTAAALLDPPTFLDESREILRHPEAFRFLRERLAQSALFSEATKSA
jgi:hypothetical protein